MHRLTLALGAAVIGLGLTGGAQAQAPLNIAFTIHSSPSNTFWQAVKKGFDDACQKVQANCQMIFTQTEGSIAEQQANMQTALAANPDALITSIVDNSAFDELIKGARDKGILVIATNVDDTEGAKGSARQAFIGQGFIPAGYTLAKAQSANFPADGPIHVLVGVSAPGQNWSEQRAAGVIKFMEEYKAANTNREVTIERIDPKVTHSSKLARVHITTAATGVSAPGTVYRMDEVPLPLRPALRSPYPTDEEVLRRIREAAARKATWKNTPEAALALS